MKKIVLSALVAVALCAGSAAAKDIQTVVFTPTPAMHCGNCEAKIKNQLKFEKGVKKIETSVENQTVTIVYDADKTSEKALKNSLAKIKYDVKKVENATKTACETPSGNCKK